MFRSRNYLILTFHGVLPESLKPINARHMPETKFAALIRLLRSRYEIVPLSQLTQMQETGIEPNQRTIAITFDGGYENLLHCALPVLKAFQVPATVFPVTGHLIDPNFMMWFDALDVVISQENPENIRVNGDIFVSNHKGSKGKEYVREGNLQTIQDYMSGLGDNRESEMLDFKRRYEFETRRKETNPLLWRILSPDQMREMAGSSLISFGSQGIWHGNFARISPAFRRYEFSESKKSLEEILQKEVTAFAYPNGHFSADANADAFEAGYQTLLGSFHRALGEKKIDGEVHPRLGVSPQATPSGNHVNIALGFTDLL